MTPSEKSEWSYYINGKKTLAIKCRMIYIGVWEVVQYKLGPKPKIIKSYQEKTRDNEWPSIIERSTCKISQWTRVKPSAMKFLEEIND